MSGVNNLILATALKYAAGGWPVFPGGVDKKPLVKDWPNVATTAPEQIKAWWTRHPGASIGAPTGPGMGKSGAWVLDVDLPDGPATLAALEAEHGPLPATVEQRTGGGGRQLFFQWPEGREVRNTAGERGKLGAGLDVRGAGGYVILPPSRHPSGGAYAWSGNSAPLAPAPEWLLNLVAPLPKPEAPKPPKSGPAKSGGSTPYGRSALEEEAAKVAGTAQGGRNHALNAAAFVVAQLVAGGELDRDEAEAALMAAAEQCGLSEREALQAIGSGFKAGEKEPRQAPDKPARMPQDAPQGRAACIAPSDAECAPWNLARELFPRIPFPWGVFPPSIARSLKQLARACATSAMPLPAQALCLVAAAVGRKIDVLAKASWREPLVFWACDIRDSGAGKTAPMWELARELTKRQANEHERFKAEQEEWAKTGPQERQGMTPPRNPRGYFTTNLTLEGVHTDLDGHKTGGLAVLLSELSALISGQNQYKKGGTDREGWLCLHDGKPARVTRSRGSVFIQGARVQVCGGIQPAIFRQVFGGEGGQYIEDGTVFRCLFTFEPSQHHELTAEAWTDEHREAWAKVLGMALDWADIQTEPLLIALAPDAQDRFFKWRNALDIQRLDLPPNFRGFLPKAYGYALRTAGVLHSLERFAAGREPGNVLSLAEMERAIQVVHFYLGQAVDALRLLVGDGEQTAPVEVSGRTVLLAHVLERLRGEVDNGRLAVGFIQEAYNAKAKPEERLSSHATGALLRSCGLTVSNGKHDANGHRACRCLLWNKAADSFAEQSLSCLQSLQPQAEQGAAEADFESLKSELSANIPEVMQTMQTLQTQCLQPGSKSWHGLTDNSDNADFSPRVMWDGPAEVEV